MTSASSRAEEKGDTVDQNGLIAIDTTKTGRRERKKQETHRRIFEAAARLFAEKGYTAVTTQEVAEAADVGAGTLFRYAGNKAELLIMIMNERLRLGAESALDKAQRGSSPADSIFALIEPLVQAFLSQPANTAIFQREVLFGADGPYRAEALNRIRRLEATMATILHAYAETHATRPGADVRRAASVIFSVLYMRLVRLELGQVNPQILPEVLRSDIEYLVRELLGVQG